MSTTFAEPKDLDISEPNELLIKEARRKGRRRHIRGSLIVLAALLVTVLLIVGWGGRTSPNKLTTGGDAKSPASTARLLCHDALGARALNSAAEKVNTVLPTPSSRSARAKQLVCAGQERRAPAMSSMPSPLATNQSESKVSRVLDSNRRQRRALSISLS